MRTAKEEEMKGGRRLMWEEDMCYGFSFSLLHLLVSVRLLQGRGRSR